jgi:hypothetical protein
MDGLSILYNNKYSVRRKFLGIVRLSDAVGVGRWLILRHGGGVVGVSD